MFANLALSLTSFINVLHFFGNPFRADCFPSETKSGLLLYLLLASFHSDQIYLLFVSFHSEQLLQIPQGLKWVHELFDFNPPDELKRLSYCVISGSDLTMQSSLPWWSSWTFRFAALLTGDAVSELVAQFSLILAFSFLFTRLCFFIYKNVFAFLIFKTFHLHMCMKIGSELFS